MSQSETGNAIPDLFSSGEGLLSNNNSVLPLLIAALMICGLILVVWFRMWRESRRNRVATSDEEVFKALSDANGLSSHQVFVLRDMYHDLSVQNPVTLFVCPQLYHAYLEHVSGPRAQVVRAIHDQVFSE